MSDQTSAAATQGGAPTQRRAKKLGTRKKLGRPRKVPVAAAGEAAAPAATSAAARRAASAVNGLPANAKTHPLAEGLAKTLLLTPPTTVEQGLHILQTAAAAMPAIGGYEGGYVVAIAKAA
jgi:hypothetical protein